MKKIMALLNTEAIKYIIFGVLTTIVNLLVFMILDGLEMRYTISNIIAFVISIIFAFVTNKIYVFQSKEWKVEVVLREGMTFIVARLATFLIDMGLLVVMVEFSGINEITAKVLVNILVIVINYILSKLIIFKRSKDMNHEYK